MPYGYIAPSAYIFAVNDCPAGSTYQCGLTNWGGSTGTRRGSDLALIRLASSAPAFATRTPVISSLQDDYAVPGAAFAHRTLDSAGSFYSRATIPQPAISGWGTPSCGGLVRRSGAAQFESVGLEWHKGCSESYSCMQPGSITFPTSCSYTMMDGTVASSNTWYRTDSIRVARTSSSPFIWDGPVASNGDSGGPLFLDYTDPIGNPKRYLVGVLSGGFQAGGACGLNAPAQYYTNEYAAPFTADNGRWVEKTAEYWASSDYQARANGWSPTPLENLDGTLGSGPSASSFGVNNLDAYVLGGDSKIWRNHWNGTAWTWTGPVSNEIVTSPPASTSWSAGRTDIVARGQAGQLLHIWSDNGYNWSTESLGGGILAGTAPGVATWGPNSLHIFVTGNDGALYYREYSAGGGWGSFQDLRAMMNYMTSGPAVAAWAPGRLDVFAQRADGKLVTIHEERFAGAALGWQYGAFSYFGNSNFAANQGVSVASWAPGRLDVFGRDAAQPSNLIHLAHQSQGWERGGASTVQAGGAGGTPAATSWAPGRLDLFVEGSAPNHNLMHRWYPL